MLESGFTSHVLSDHGMENILVALMMNIIRGLRVTVLTSLGDHNQSIERLWRDVHKHVTEDIYIQLYGLEDAFVIKQFCREKTYRTWLVASVILHDFTWILLNFYITFNRFVCIQRHFMMFQFSILHSK